MLRAYMGIDRKSVVKGKCVDLGGRRIIKKFEGLRDLTVTGVQTFTLPILVESLTAEAGPGRVGNGLPAHVEGVHGHQASVEGARLRLDGVVEDPNGSRPEDLL